MRHYRTYGKKMLSIFLAALMCLSFVALDVTGIFGKDQTAKAYEANPQHTFYCVVKQGWNLGSQFDGRDSSTELTLKGKTGDGYNNDETIRYGNESDENTSGCWAYASGSDGRGDAQSPTISNANWFPTSVKIGIKLCDSSSANGSQNITSRVELWVYNNNTGTYVKAGQTSDFSFSSSTNFWGSGSTWKRTGYMAFNWTGTGLPAANYVSASDKSLTIDKTGGSNKTVTLNAYVYDQYGVIWKAAPQSWSIQNAQGYNMSLGTTGAGESSVLTVQPTNQTVGRKNAVIRASHNSSIYKDFNVTITPTYKINFNTTDNGGTSAAPAAQGATATGTTTTWTIPNNDTYKPTKVKSDTGTWTFVGWTGTSTNTTSGVVAPGSPITIDNYNDTLYAVFKKEVTANFYYFDTSGNRVLSSGSIPNDKKTGYNNDTTVTFDVPNSAASKSFTLNGLTYTFDGWKIGDSAAGAATVAKGTTTSKQNIRNAAYNYYAVYKATLPLKYDTNSIGTARTASPSSITTQTPTQYLVASASTAAASNRESVSVTLSDTSPTRTGMVTNGFLGWRMYNTYNSNNSANTITSAMRESEDASGLYQPGATVTVDQAKTLLAVYKDQRHTVTVKDYNGDIMPVDGSETQTIRYAYDAKALVLNTDPTQAVRADDVYHYVFDKFTRAWNNDKNNPLFKTIIQDEVIYAKYRGIAHDYEIMADREYVQPTCTTPGHYWEKCTVCGHEHYVAIPAPGHDFSDLEGYKTPTCTKAGSYGSLRCSVCGAYDEEYPLNADSYPRDPETNEPILDDNGEPLTAIPALGHKAAAYTADNQPVKTGTVAPTCSTKGYDYYTCTQCGQDIKIAGTDTGPTEHPADQITTVPEVPATCTDTGLTSYTKCGACGQLVTKPTTIPALGHDLVKHAKVEATCADGGRDGAKAYAVCNRCGRAFLTTDSGSVTSEIRGEGATPTAAEIAAAIKIDAPDHVWVEVAAQPATCTRAGHTGGTVCQNCGEPQEGSTAVETEPAKGHNWVVDETRSYTSDKPCKEQSYTYYYCDRDGCGATKIEYTELQEHTWTDVDEITATCYRLGKSAHQKCTVCDAETEYTVTPMLEHNYVVLTNAVPATCTVPGATAAYKCSNAGCESVIAAKEVPAKGHTFSAWTETAPATCTEDGSASRYCLLNCGLEGANETKVLPALGHNYLTKEAVEPTCTKGGNTAGKWCTRCGDTDGTSYQVLAKLGHDLEEINRQDATCAASGFVKNACSRCDYEEVVILDKLTEHPADAIITDSAIPATCTEVGYTAGSHCSICGEIIEEQVLQAKLPHERLVIDSYPATCTEPGFTGAVKCANCGITLEEGEAIPAKGHNYTGAEWVTVSATCTTDGSRTRACVNGCGTNDVVVLPATGHDWVTDKAVAATCTASGLTEGKHCSKCDAKVAQQVVDVLGHDLTTVTSAATCTDKGYTLTTCSRCNYSEKTYTDNALGHIGGTATCIAKAVCERCGRSYGSYAEHNWVKDTEASIAPTCIAGGSNVYVCSVCGESKTETLGTTDHVFNEADAVVVEPTCTTAGHVTVNCAVCGQPNEMTLPALGHDVHNWHQEGGVAYGTCDRCGEELTDTPSAVGLEPERCEKCGLIHEGRTGIFVYNGLYCKIVGFFRSIIKLFKK
ncbi:MAG: hypothetical protein IJK02_05850 [Clostridia bacterium]|nr:hypothetical protein [Clostridia bacterium]